jgi:3D-(3,5/4)-trihydroxycyclohexane-1,2-dione acylhydrolase (decyclizing)
MNSDIYSSVLTGKKLIVLVLDNGGFAVINKLQNNTGQRELQQPDRGLPDRARTLRRRFRGARAIDGRDAVTVANPAELGEAFKRAKAADKTTSSSCRSTPMRAGHRRPHLVGGRHAAGLETRSVREKHAEMGSRTRPSSGRGSDDEALPGNQFRHHRPCGDGLLSRAAGHQDRTRDAFLRLSRRLLGQYRRGDLQARRQG